MNLVIGQSNTVSFKVNVMGTSQLPMVRVIISTVPEMIFPATFLNDAWRTTMTIPAHISPGVYDVRVEVVVASKLFTPLTRKLELVLSSSASVPVIPVTAVPPDVEPKETSLLDLITKSADVPAEVTMPVQAERAEEPLSALSRIANAPAKRMYERINSGLPKAAKQTTPISVSIADIDKIAPKTITESKVVKPKKVIKENKTPIRLVKGEIIYE